MQVAYVRKSEIEREANHLIKCYEAKHGKINDYIIPVEEIAEFQLGYHFEILDLNVVFPNQEVNGFIDFDNNRIGIHSDLEPSENPSYIGRYNSTIAHECGHHVLHKGQVLSLLSQGDLFSDKIPNKILCRKSDAKESIEWQADCFAGYLTMPKDKIYSA